jgi:DNA recombination protein RmuC
MPIESVLLALAALIVGVGFGWAIWGRSLAAGRTELVEERALHTAARDSLVAAQRDAALAAKDAEERAREVAAARGETARLAARVEALEADRLALAELRSQQAERDANFAKREHDLEQRFATLAAEALGKSHEEFVKRAEETLKLHRETANQDLGKNRTALGELLGPVQESLKRYETRLAEVEVARTESYGKLTQLLDTIGKGQERVSAETGKLASVLRSSGKAAGRWGEEQCRNVLEQAGLVEGVDYTAQTTVSAEAGKQRPDFTVQLPGGRKLVIDVKCSLDAYALAAEAETEEDRDRHLRSHAAAIRSHANALASKAYEKAVDGAYDFVVMFVHGENYLAAAMGQDRTLMNDFMSKRVVLAGPINLIAIARTVAAMRDQARLAEQAAQIAKLGRDLYDSIRIMGKNLGGVHKQLAGTVESWNAFVGQVESRVIGRARKFEALGATTGLDPIVELHAIEKVPVLPNAPDLAPPAEAAE